MKPKKVSFFLHHLDSGGAEKAAVNVIKELVKKNPDNLKVDVVLSQAKGSYLPEIPKEVSVIDLGASRLITSLPNLIKYLREEKPDTLISFLDYVNLIAIWAKLLSLSKTKLIINIQNNLSTSSHNSLRLREKLIPTLASYFYPFADEIIAVSEGVANDLSQFIKLPRKRIKVIYNPVVIPEMLDKAKQPLDHPWFASGEPPVILGVGRLTKQKDFPNLIHAFYKVQQHQPARLIILGEGEERSNLEDLIKNLEIDNIVEMPGFVNNPYCYMSQATVFVLSSSWEGFGNVIAEALACGTPVVSTDCPSGPAEILEQGKYGQLVPIKDSESLSEAIIKSLSFSGDVNVLRTRGAFFSGENIINLYNQIL